jgi:hypothetical protein
VNRELVKKKRNKYARRLLRLKGRSENNFTSIGLCEYVRTDIMEFPSEQAIAFYCSYIKKLCDIDYFCLANMFCLQSSIYFQPEAVMSMLMSGLRFRFQSCE